MGESPLAQWRKRAGLSQAQLARLLGVHRSTVSFVERGATLGKKVYRRLAERYGVPLEILLRRQREFMASVESEADQKFRKILEGER